MVSILNIPNIIILAAVLFIVGLVIGYFLRKYIARLKVLSAEEEAKRTLSEARVQVEALRKQAILEAKEGLHKEREDLERESRLQRSELQKLETRLLQREENLDRKVDILEKREKEFVLREKNVVDKEQTIEGIIEEQRKNLQRISGLTVEEAKKMLLESLQDKIKNEAEEMTRRIEAKVRESAEKKAREIVGLAIQRCAVEETTESTVCAVNLPEEMKGRVIGREGRNIRAIEAAAGVDLLIDDTPGVLVISCFDPARREIARLSLEKLITDGRIQPTRIEETVEKAKKEFANIIKEEGEKAVFEMGINNLHPEQISLLGRLKYRTSYGQNVLQHSKEVAYLARMMAAELGLDTKIVSRAGLLHDLGKAVDQEMEGTHTQIGVDLARKYKESTEVIHAIACHHEEEKEEPKTVEAVLIRAADAISASRPGVRKETLEAYMKRLQNLEAVAQSFPGVEKVYAIQAGREIRVMVKPEEVDDHKTQELPREIAQKIEQSLQYPGQIKVTVLRELRASEYAK